MKDTPTKPASSYLKPKPGDLQTVLSKVSAIQSLNKLLEPLLDPSVRPYCQVANLTNGVLVVLTANGSVATQLRYQSKDLMKALHKNHALKHIRQIQFKVRPATAPIFERPVDQSKHRSAASPLSSEAAQTLIDMASTIEDPELRAAMEKIAKNRG